MLAGDAWLPSTSWHRGSWLLADAGTAAVTVQSGSTASFVQLAATDLVGFAAGSVIAVDADYSGQTGFIGAPISGAYLRNALADVDYTRRVTFNVALVAQVGPTGLTLAAPLPGGVPMAGAQSADHSRLRRRS